ncbi:MAG TPA: hypothetical protein PKC18_21190, partial [Lacipirellulaceae bacterium]|nr:hypothetical protein [Lacipirellulaceae bacterium]
MTQDPDAQEDSTIPRGEALAGLGLLGLLAAGVVGTIGFRIVSAPPRRPAPHADMIWASQTPPSAVENALVDAVPPAAARGTAD